LDGVVPRAGNAEELAAEIDNVFSDEEYRKSVINRCRRYCKENNWDVTSDRYLELYPKVFPANSLCL
jgi:glycosyltransferase involved in cell wall biosynthesis